MKQKALRYIYWAVTAVLMTDVAGAQSNQPHTELDLTKLPGLMIGHKVNIKTDSQRGVRGEVLDLTPDAITVSKGRKKLRIVAAEIAMIERINPRSRGRAVAGGIVGGIVGLIAGSLTSYAVADGAPVAVPYTIIGGGTIIGSFVGAKIAGSRNTVVYLRPPNARPSAPSPQAP